ncbi:Uma2 family endonuclease [Streptomyces sp. 2333.5]|uniref:Uma2 family endonuclease n=1 Tax=unclassified Streptomyces TaxID=2593676 RepID=UPI00089CF697|nr:MULTISPECIES: Uma2 family endonuclease [unclassified Streptomyces]PJJ04381.1 Uma2 family endonuclease [Streptomyces sp. 2333.5]SEE49340.1 Endonuclease, Uma2 family (restriction endonuclease fold) [Streptomyces sp. 2314.4]SEE76081.1 Endonuclease, Uma2 family (restriction endonuclease fold) [Streptomyces sp. 2112.2]SOE11268.1 Endonuclease, Uma2 family (restriction endonuclease fold) [Streptomyces sp. 2323.1]
MTALADQPHIMETEHFEEAARIFARLERGARLEFIDGKIRSKAVPDRDHGRIMEWLTRICVQARPELRLHPDQGLKVQAHRGGRARPDAELVPSGAFAGQGAWAAPDPVLMVVEVTSHDSDTDQRDRVEKPRVYAETGIPLYLLVDREACQVSVHSEPDGGRYEVMHTVSYGKSLHLPAPVGITLETEQLKDWVN